MKLGLNPGLPRIEDGFFTSWATREALHNKKKKGSKRLNNLAKVLLIWLQSFSFNHFPTLQPSDQIQVSHIAGGFFTSWATREAQEHWRGYPISSPEDLPDPRIELRSPALQADSLPTELSGKLFTFNIMSLKP